MKSYLPIIYKAAFWLSFLGLFAIIFDYGYSHTKPSHKLLDEFYFVVLGISLFATFLRYLNNLELIKRKVFIFDLLSICFSLWIVYMYLFVGIPFKTDLLLENPLWLRLAVILSFIREFSELNINYNRTLLNPAQLFVVSFILIILCGTLLLMLPNATFDGISFTNALFTATSAVCVTGLIVVDTGTYFTEFGQFIIMSLIQLGGLGILTFASYFSYFFKGGSSYENHFVLSDLTSSNKIGDVFSTLKYVLVITVSIELISAILIFFTLDGLYFETLKDEVFFSVFHSISAFCNAGFSTLQNSLYQVGFKYNYLLQLIIIATFVIGGLGFPIVSNVVKYLKYRIKRLLDSRKKPIFYRPWILNLDSRITLVTTFSITIVAFLVFFVLEFNNTLSQHEGFGKIVTALFGATTPRTAGFNTIDMSAMLFPTTMMVFLLMWIGASPASTGGGIKTSTFAVATLNILSLAKGRNRIEVFRREIADITVKRAFAIIALSLVVNGAGIMVISAFDSDVSLINIAFECFSAYSTVGLSLGITAALSVPSKYVLIFIMFVGRVSMLTIFIALFNKVKSKNYRYPTEEITIN